MVPYLCARTPRSRITIEFDFDLPQSLFESIFGIPFSLFQEFGSPYHTTARQCRGVMNRSLDTVEATTQHAHYSCIVHNSLHVRMHPFLKYTSANLDRVTFVLGPCYI